MPILCALLLACATLLAAPSAPAVSPLAPAPIPSSAYLYVWSGVIDSSGPDFLAVFDVRDDGTGDRYGALVTTVPVPGRGNGPHHTEHELAADGQLFANGFRSGQSFIFDLSNP